MMAPAEDLKLSSAAAASSCCGDFDAVFSSPSSVSSDDGGAEGVVTSCRKRTYGLDVNVVRSRKRRLLLENLSILRSLTHSSATRKSCIILDAFNYIEELKRRVCELNKDLAEEREVLGSHETWVESSRHVLPRVAVVSNGSCLEIHISCEKWPGLLVAVLEAVEALGLNVLQARVSCEDYFLFEAFSGEDHQGQIADPNAVKAALVRVIDRINPHKADSPPRSEVLD